MKHILVLLVLIFSLTAGALPKYGPNAVPLSKDPNREYFKKNDAPDFWALISYYLPQPHGWSCSATSITVLFNGARPAQDLSSEDELVSYQSLLDKYSDDRYKKVMGDHPITKPPLKFMNHDDVSNARLTEVMTEGLKKLKVWTDKSSVTPYVIDQNNLTQSRKDFHDQLVKNEKSADDFILISFVQGILTGDPDGMIAHVADIAAYDEKKHLILLLDPDRQFYGPYWSLEDKVFDAIADKRSDQKPGWVYLKVR